MQTDYRRKLVHMNALPMNKLTRVALVAILALMGTAPACGQALVNLTRLAAIRNARSEIISIVNADKRIGYKFVRLGFHDCVGGCDGCVDLLNPDNNGLAIPIAELTDIVRKYSIKGITRADMWVLAAQTSAEVLNSVPSVAFPFKWYGRPTCDQRTNIDACKAGNCALDRGPDRKMPSGNFDTHQVLTYFKDTFGFDTEETVTLMGAHAIGKVNRINSGYAGDGWSSTPTVLNNSYYAQLIGLGSTTSELVQRTPQWRRAEIDNTDFVDVNGNPVPTRHQWNFTNLFMLNADIAMVRNFTGRISADGEVSCTFRGNTRCPIARETFQFMAKYRNNNTLWVEKFSKVFTSMLEFPYRTGAGCAARLCFIANLFQ